MAKYENSIQDISIQLKSLSDSSRLRLFMVLQGTEICVCHLTEMLKLAPSTVSKHLSILKSAQLVTSVKKGQWIYYSALPVFPELIQSLVQDQTILKDRLDLKNIQKRICIPDEN